MNCPYCRLPENGKQHSNPPWDCNRARDNEIARLRSRVAELEAELAQAKRAARAYNPFPVVDQTTLEEVEP